MEIEAQAEEGEWDKQHSGDRAGEDKREQGRSGKDNRGEQRHRPKTDEIVQLPVLSHQPLPITAREERGEGWEYGLGHGFTENGHPGGKIVDEAVIPECADGQQRAEDHLIALHMDERQDGNGHHLPAIVGIPLDHRRRVSRQERTCRQKSGRHDGIRQRPQQGAGGDPVRHRERGPPQRKKHDNAELL